MKLVFITSMLVLLGKYSNIQDGIDGKYYRWDCEESYDTFAEWDCSEDKQLYLYISKDGTAKEYTVSNGSESLVGTFVWSRKNDTFTLEETNYQLIFQGNGNFSLKNVWSEHFYYLVDIIEQ